MYAIRSYYGDQVEDLRRAVDQQVVAVAAVGHDELRQLVAVRLELAGLDDAVADLRALAEREDVHDVGSVREDLGELRESVVVQVLVGVVAAAGQQLSAEFLV